MGILENVIGSLLGGSSGSSSGIGNVLSSILGGGQAGSGPMGGQMAGGQTGGLGDLVSKFEQAGLGQIAQSWIGNGPNQSVSPDQLKNVFGDQVPQMAENAGLPQGDFLSQLSQHLPNAVNGVTPTGEIPNQGSVNV